MEETPKSQHNDILVPEAPSIATPYIQYKVSPSNPKDAQAQATSGSGYRLTAIITDP